MDRKRIARRGIGFSTGASLIVLLVTRALPACSESGTVVSADNTSDASSEATGPDTSVGAPGAGETGPAGDAGAEGDGESGGPDADAGDCSLGPAGEPLELRCTGLYSDWSSKTIAPGVRLYDPGLHLWSDGADKTRWIQIPAGQKIDTSNMDEWTFPVGTKVWKEFRLPLTDGGAPTRVETRLLWKQSSSTWYRTTYRWSADGESSTTELTAGELDAGGVGYEVPSQVQCDKCHDGRLDGVLGFEAVALSSPGASGVTVQTLVAEGLLTAPPSTPFVIPGNAVESAALGYLHVNCGIACHNQGNGAASGTGFFMRLDVARLASVQATDTWTTGWNQPTGVFQIADAATSYRLHACDTASSCVYYRASRRAGLDGTPLGVQMPPVDTHKIDDAGLAAIAAWINQGCDGGQ